jgi:hypothetical protein
MKPCSFRIKDAAICLKVIIGSVLLLLRCDYKLRLGLHRIHERLAKPVAVSVSAGAGSSESQIPCRTVASMPRDRPETAIVRKKPCFPGILILPVELTHPDIRKVS